MKLIKTDLLKQNHISDVAIATASHIDFCKYQRKCLKSEWSFKRYVDALLDFIQLLIIIIFLPIVRLTNGLLLYPVLIVIHIKKVKNIVRHRSIERINKNAKELIEELKGE